jgi:peptide/nickel transport system substrate-binding protein
MKDQRIRKFGVVTALLLAGAAMAATPKDTLVYQEASDIPTLDPSIAYDTGSYQVIENVYEGLLTYKGSSVKDLEPVLATGWKISNGGKTYTFALRKGVKFHSGADFSCKDAQYTYQRNLVINNPDSGIWYLAEPLLGTQSNANDDKSVTWDKISKAVTCSAQGDLVFNLANVDPAFLGKLAAGNMVIVDRANAIKVGEWDGTEASWKSWVGKDTNASALSKNPSGTGAYRVVKNDANALLAQAFPGYWGKKPAIQNVVIQKVGEQATRLEALKRGDADLIETGPRPVLQQLKGAPGIVVVDDLPNVVSTAFFMNENIKDAKILGSGKLDGNGIPANFFGDVNVRRAFSYAFDYAGYIKDVSQGKGIQRTMLLPDIYPGYDAEVRKYSFDPKQATAYFKRAFGGQLWKNGFTLNANYRAGSTAVQSAMEILKKNVEALNPKFKVNIAGKQWSQMLTDSKDGKEAMIVIGWVPDYVDADNFMYTFYSSKGYYFPRNNWKDPTTDKWLDQARSTIDQAKRDKLYSLVGNRAFEQAPFILYPAAVNFLVYRDNLVGLSKATYNPMVSFYSGTFWKELSKK